MNTLEWVIWEHPCHITWCLFEDEIDQLNSKLCVKTNTEVTYPVRDIMVETIMTTKRAAKKANLNVLVRLG